MSQPGAQFLKAFQENAPWIHVGGGRFMQLMTAPAESIPMLEGLKLPTMLNLTAHGDGDGAYNWWLDDDDPLVDYDNSWAE